MSLFQAIKIYCHCPQPCFDLVVWVCNKHCVSSEFISFIHLVYKMHYIITEWPQGSNCPGRYRHLVVYSYNYKIQTCNCLSQYKVFWGQRPQWDTVFTTNTLYSLFHQELRNNWTFLSGLAQTSHFPGAYKLWKMKLRLPGWNSAMVMKHEQY